jgi:hypothetical protein
LRCADLDGGCGVSTRASPQLGSRPGLAWIADRAVQGAVSSGATDCWHAAKTGAGVGDDAYGNPGEVLRQVTLRNVDVKVYFGTVTETAYLSPNSQLS